MQFDYVYMSGANHSYGFVRGNENIVFIKSGLGGSCFGFENKYLQIARRLNSKFGATIICASNPHDNKSHIEVDRRAIDDYIIENNISYPNLYFFGNSNGCIKGLQMSSAGCHFNKMVLVNMPLMINYHRTKAMIQEAKNTDILAVYGGKDPSVSYLPYIKDKYVNFKTNVFPQADHNFKGMLDEFIALADHLFI